MLKVLGDFSEAEKAFEENKITFDDFQEYFTKARHNGIDGSVKPFAVGGSDAAIVFGLSPWKAPKQLVLEKLYPERFKELTPPDKRHILDLGHHFEEGIARMCAELLRDKLNVEVELIPSTLQYLNTEYPHCIADIDYLIKVAGKLYLVEVKSTRPFSEAAKTFQMGGVPVYYQYRATCSSTSL